MAKGNTTDTDFLEYTFNGTPFSWDAAAQLDIHLHNADPTASGNTTTHETAYTNYALVAVNRSPAKWTVAGNVVSNADLIQFPACGATGDVITHVSIAAHGTTQILYYGALNSPLTVSNLIQPQFTIGSLQIQES